MEVRQDGGSLSTTHSAKPLPSPLFPWVTPPSTSQAPLRIGVKREDHSPVHPAGLGKLRAQEEVALKVSMGAGWQLAAPSPPRSP